MNKSFHIAFGVDEGFMHPMGVTITSIIENNMDVDLTFHVFISAISENSKNRIKQLEKKYSRKIQIHVVDKAFFDSSLDFSTPPSHVSPATYMRFLMPSTLKEHADRVLYLDADILCIGSIAGLINFDLGDSVIAGIHDVDKDMATRQCSKFGIAHGKYFNAGVMLIDIGRWLEQGIVQKAMGCVNNKDLILDYADQDALNIVLDGKVEFIDAKWNWQYRLLTHVRSGNSSMNVPNESVFIHFIGPMKPWREWNPHASKDLFMKYHLLSTWSDIKLESKANYKERHVLSRYFMQKGEFKKGFVHFFKYLSDKYI